MSSIERRSPFARFESRRLVPAVTRATTALACAGLVLVAGSTAQAAQQASTSGSAARLYVSPKGNDGWSGRASAPLRTIAAAVRRAPNGTVVVASGGYHETLTLQGGSGLRLLAAPGASVWLDGSRRVNNWQRSGGHWVSRGWTTRFDSSPTLTAGAPDGTNPAWRFVNPAYPMAAHPDQLWIDGVAQRQVSSSDKVGPGSFYADYGRSQLVMGSNPTGHQVRASDLAKAISVREPNVSISGINVRRYAPSVPTIGAVTVERPNARLSHLQIKDNATSGLQVGASGANLSHLTLRRNGMIGLRATRANGLRLDHVSADDNNRERFNPAPSAGGVKITRTSGLKVTDSSFTSNFGTGLWLDESVYNFRVYRSHMARNSSHGLSLEISGTGAVVDNLLNGNRGDGIKVNDTDRVQVWNNSIVGNGRAINIAQDARDLPGGPSYRDHSLPLTFRSERINVRNNILANSVYGNCLLCVEDHSQPLHSREAADHGERQRLPAWRYSTPVARRLVAGSGQPRDVHLDRLLPLAHEPGALRSAAGSSPARGKHRSTQCLADAAHRSVSSAVGHQRGRRQGAHEAPGPLELTDSWESPAPSAERGTGERRGGVDRIEVDSDAHP